MAMNTRAVIMNVITPVHIHYEFSHQNKKERKKEERQKKELLHFSEEVVLIVMAAQSCHMKFSRFFFSY